MRNKLILLLIAFASFTALPSLSAQYVPITNLGVAVGDTASASQTKYYYLVTNSNYASLFMSTVRVVTLSGTATGTIVLEACTPPSNNTSNTAAFWAPVDTPDSLVAGATKYYKLDYLAFSERRLRLRLVTTSATQSITVSIQGALRRRTSY